MARLLKHLGDVSTLAEIEKAAEKLSPQQKQELMLFLSAKLRDDLNGHAPRALSASGLPAMSAGRACLTRP